MKKSPERESMLALLKRTFGYTSFRPLQEQIITDCMAGQDVARSRLALAARGGVAAACIDIQEICSHTPSAI